MKKIRSYSSIWSVEKVIYAINDMRLPFPITFSQMAWFVACEFAVLALGGLPPLSMIDGALLKYFGIPVGVTWFMSQKRGTARSRSALSSRIRPTCCALNRPLQARQ